MGIITNLSFNSLCEIVERHTGAKVFCAKETESGISDTVYTLQTSIGNLVFKLYEQSDFESVQREIRLLDDLRRLGVATALTKEPFEVCGKPAVIYKAVTGKHPTKPTPAMLYEIGRFLFAMHTVTAGQKSENKSFNEMFCSFSDIIQNTPFAPFRSILEEMTAIGDDGVIHGDLFPDNLFFDGDRLSGVIDFIEAANGAFLFDLGVVAFSFCVHKAKIDKELASALLTGYEHKEIDMDTLTKYARYAALFYGINRYVKNKSWEGCFDFIAQT